MLRGCLLLCGSCRQKKRVTLGEMTVGPSKVIFADEISTGLDSATTFDIVTGMREHARHSRSTQLIALLQPTPETIELFDDVMVSEARWGGKKGRKQERKGGGGW